MIRNQIVKEALSFVGQEEIRGNIGFKEDKFQQYMETMGWDKGQAWCAYFAELVWKMAYSKFDSTFISRLDKLFNAGAVATWNNFSKSDFKTSDIPEPGDVVIWQSLKNGKPHWTGHAGVVIEVNGNTFKSVEGNTNDKGGREGYIVAVKDRPLNFEPKEMGLVLKGFIKPIEV